MRSSKAPKKGLLDFAASRRRAGKVCWLCTIPEREELDKAYHKGLRQAAMLDWLRTECRYAPDDATYARITYHFDRMHHERKAA